MHLIYKKHCYFYRHDAKNNLTCLLHRRKCLFCPNQVPVIEGMDAKDYVSLSFSRSSFRASFIIAVIALIISFASLLTILFTNPPQ